MDIINSVEVGTHLDTCIVWCIKIHPTSQGSVLFQAQSVYKQKQRWLDGMSNAAHWFIGRTTHMYMHLKRRGNFPSVLKYVGIHLGTFFGDVKWGQAPSCLLIRCVLQGQYASWCTRRNVVAGTVCKSSAHDASLKSFYSFKTCNKQHYSC